MSATSNTNAVITRVREPAKGELDQTIDEPIEIEDKNQPKSRLVSTATSAVDGVDVEPRDRDPVTEESDQTLEPSNGIEGKNQPRFKTIAEKEQDHKHDVEDRKIRIGSSLLALCFFVIVLFAVFNAFWGIDSTLFSGTFEFSKTIATAIIGYLFAEKTISK